MNQDTASDDGDDRLLPWLATGRLGASDTSRIEALLESDPDLRHGLAVAQEEQAATVMLNEALGAPSPSARAALFARIDASATRPRTGLVERFGAWLSALGPRAVAVGALGALALTVMQAGVLSGLLLPRAGPTYSTASAPPVTEGTVVLVAFAPQASAAAIAASLRAVQASIVGGPHPGDLFEVRVSDMRLSRAELDAVMVRLRSDGDVVRLVTRATSSDD